MKTELKQSKTKEPLFVAFATQKGGVGKSTFTTLTASWLHYAKGLDVAVVDCDHPQYSLDKARKREVERVNTDQYYIELAHKLFSQIDKSVFPILTTPVGNALKTAEQFLSNRKGIYDVVFFDLPGTVDTPGVLNTLIGLDYLFIPISADPYVIDSSLGFAHYLQQNVVPNPDIRLRGVYLFWNMVVGSEKTSLYNIYQKTITEMGIPLLKTFIPASVKFKKEISDDRNQIFRSTILPANLQLFRQCRMDELTTEICSILNLYPNER